MEPVQAAFIGDVFWWTSLSVVLGLLIRALDPDDAS
jgi:predicted secreted protein